MKKRLLTKLQESETKLEETVARASLLEKNKHRLEQEMEDLAIEVDRCADWCKCWCSCSNQSQKPLIHYRIIYVH